MQLHCVAQQLDDGRAFVWGKVLDGHRSGYRTAAMAARVGTGQQQGFEQSWRSARQADDA